MSWLIEARNWARPKPYRVRLYALVWFVFLFPWLLVGAVACAIAKTLWEAGGVCTVAFKSLISGKFK